MDVIFWRGEKRVLGKNQAVRMMLANDTDMRECLNPRDKEGVPWLVLVLVGVWAALYLAGWHFLTR